jgi:hypothetical protein
LGHSPKKRHEKNVQEDKTKMGREKNTHCLCTRTARRSSEEAPLLVIDAQASSAVPTKAMLQIVPQPVDFSPRPLVLASDDPTDAISSLGYSIL